MSARMWLAVLLLLSAMAVHAAKLNDFKIDNLYYRITSDSTVAIAPKDKKGGNKALAGDIVIPERVKKGKKEYVVTSVDTEAFKDCEKIKSITLPNTVIEIGGYAFKGCYGLSSVALPANLNEIGYFAFEYCTQLKSLDLPASLTKIGQGAFSGMGVESITLPIAILDIPSDCFGSRLKSITLSDEVRSIGNRAFSYSKLEEVNLIQKDGSVKRSRNKYVELPSKLEAIGKAAFYKCEALDTVFVPDGCKEIGEDAFDRIPNLRLSVYKGTSRSLATHASNRVDIRFDTYVERQEKERKRAEAAKEKARRDSLAQVERTAIMGEVKWAPGLSDYKKEVLQEIIDNMVFVDGGSFMMGALKSIEAEPVHKVTLDSYMIGKFEVTQKQWGAIMGYNPSRHGGDNRPVEMVSWLDCQEFIKALRRLTGLHFKLPTEAQWEFAARGGTKSRNYRYSGTNNPENTWYCFSTREGTKDVGLKPANELGLYDMSGNVYELCNDIFGSYSAREVRNPSGAKEGNRMVIRGGSVVYDSPNSTVYARTWAGNAAKRYDIGLRLAISKDYVEKKVYTAEDSIRRNHPLVKRIRWAKGINQDRKEAIIEAIGNMVMIPGGSYTFRGEVTEYTPSITVPGTEVGCAPFYMNKYETTKALWLAVFPTDDDNSEKLRLTEMSNPVVFRRTEIEKFLSELNRMTGLNFTLPTEVQWEWAARGGKESRGYNYAGTNSQDDILKRRVPNELGLYDMSHGEWELCKDIPVVPGAWWDTKYTVFRGGQRPNRAPVSIYEREVVNYDSEGGFRIVLNLK